MIYLDYAATTPLDPRVEEAMARAARDGWGNPSSLHAAGRQAQAAVDQAREVVAGLFGASPAEVVFTSGGTEADNLAVKGVARALRSRGNHVITSAFEHHAVLESCLALEREGFAVTRVRPDADGLIDPGAVAEAMRPDTVLVSIMYANNEVGTIQPIAEIGRLCRTRRITLHTDAVQAAPELPLKASDLAADLISISAHKLHGPKGVGALYVRSGTPLQALLHGGGQERERRAGTENVAGIVGLAAAISCLGDGEEMARIRSLRDRLIEELLQMPGSRLHGSRERRLANNVNVGFAGVPGETLVIALDLEGIAASTGAACTAGAVVASHVLQSMGYSLIQGSEALRLSLGRCTTEEEMERTLEVVRVLTPRLRSQG